MKKLLTLISCILLLASCKYDDSDLWEKVDDLDKRLEALEQTVQTMNTTISSLRTVVEALEDGKVVMNIEQTEDGYALKMSDGSTITLYNGRNGADAPVIGVKQDTDGYYYWTRTVDGQTEWLLDEANNKVRASGKDGVGGVTPVIGVDDDGNWTVDYGEGPQLILGPNGEPVSALGEEGPAGDSFFSSVTDNDDSVVLTLSNGTVIKLPKLTDATIAFVEEGKASVYYGYSKSLDIEIDGIRSAMVTAPCGWEASINLSTKKVRVSAPWLDEADAEFSGYIGIIAVTDGGIPVTVVKEIKAGYEVSSPAEANTVMTEVIVPHLSAAAPFDVKFVVTEDVTTYTNINIPAAMTAATTPTLTIVAQAGSSAGYVGTGAYNCAYDGEVIVSVPEGMTVKTASVMIPEGSVTFTGKGIIDNVSTLDAGNLLHVGAGTTVNTIRCNNRLGGLINEGTIGTLNVSGFGAGKEFQLIDYGKIADINDPSGVAGQIHPRAVSNGSSKFISKVIEYRPAPGQYGLSSYSSLANANSIVGKYGSPVTLGMFGGYIVFQFDHSVINWNGTDFVVRGNAFATANEPGAVMVSFDANGNGLPDDEWFELKGDLYDAESTIADYEITYTKPADDASLITWSDNKGGSGTMTKGTSKWPALYTDITTLTFSGRKIEMPTMYELSCGYGYADTFTADYKTVINGDSDTASTNKFDIDRADSPKKLLAVDFIKIYNPVYQVDTKYPTFNEISTEIAGAVSVSLSRTPVSGSGVEGWEDGGSL